MQDCQPVFIRGDCDWGNDPVITELEQMGKSDLCKVKRSQGAKALIGAVHGQGDWTRFDNGWELKAHRLQLQGWRYDRRVVVAQRRLAKDGVIGVEYLRHGQQQLALVEGPEEMCLCDRRQSTTALAVGE